VAALLLLCAVLLATGAALRVWRRPPRVPPPDVDLTGVDPALAEAIEALCRKARQEPNSAAPWGDLGQLLRDSRLVEPAIACFAQAERLAPADPRWPYLQGEGLLLRDPGAALPHLRRAAALCDRARAAPATPRLRLAEVLMSVGEDEEAANQLRRALDAEADNPKAYLLLGLLAATRGDLEESRAQLLRCQDSPYVQQKACRELAAVCRRLGDEAAAARFGERARSLPKDLPMPDPYLAVSLLTLPGKPARFQYVERLEGLRRHDEAVRVLREMLEESGPDYRVLVGLGRNLAQQGQLVAAERALGDAIRLSPDNVQAYYYLSMVKWAQAEERDRHDDRVAAEARCRDAVDSARAALAHKPDHAQAHMLLGRCLKRLGQSAEALTHLRTAVDGAPDSVEAALFLGEALAESGAVDDARTHLENARRLAGPDDQRAAEALARLAARGK
jgi:tetratricopeptide (TPR) repeat protein